MSERDSVDPVVIRRRVRPGRDGEMEAWLRGVTPVAASYPGHLGVDVVPPRTRGP